MLLRTQLEGGTLLRSRQRQQAREEGQGLCLGEAIRTQAVTELRDLVFGSIFRAKLKSEELLKENLVWGKAIVPLIEIAASKDGNPLPRVMEVIEMADRDNPKLRGGWYQPSSQGWPSYP